MFDANGPSQSELLRRLVTDHPRMRTMLAGARQAGPIKAYPLRTDYTVDASGRGDLLCIGEAAGLVNPVTGEGIDYAFESAEFAAQAIMTHWENRRPGQIGAAYRRRLKRRFALRFGIYRWLRTHCLNARNMDRFVSAMSRSPSLQRLIVEGLFGRARPSAFLRPAIVLQLLRVALSRRARTSP